MTDWIDHLSPTEARAVLDAPVKTRFAARNDRGEKITRYTLPTATELGRLRSKARGE